MDDYRRRRRLDAPQEPKGGLPIIPLIIVVLLLGLGLGKVLAVFFGGGGGAAQPTSPPTFTPLPSAEGTATASASPSSSPSPSPSPSASPSGSPSSSPSATPSVKPTASAKPSASPKTTPSPTPRASVILITPTPAVTQKAATQAPAPTPSAPPAPALITGDVSPAHASAIVRSYLNALANGQDSFATGYLKEGLPTETFVTKGSKITNIQATQTGQGAYNVTALIESTAGTYNESFTVQAGPQGMQITDHVPVKVP